MHTCILRMRRTDTQSAWRGIPSGKCSWSTIAARTYRLRLSKPRGPFLLINRSFETTIDLRNSMLRDIGKWVAEQLKEQKAKLGEHHHDDSEQLVFKINDDILISDQQLIRNKSIEDIISEQVSALLT